MFFFDRLCYKIELKKGERSKIIALYILIFLVIASIVILTINGKVLGLVIWLSEERHLLPNLMT